MHAMDWAVLFACLAVGCTGFDAEIQPPPKSYMVSPWAGTGAQGAADGPGSVATFNGPAGIALGPDGSLYVTDQGNNMIRKIATDGTVSTYAGTGKAGLNDGDCLAAAAFSSPEGITVDAAGNVYVADSSNHAIRKITPSPSCRVSTLAGSDKGLPGDSEGTGTAAAFNFPYGVTWDASANLLYVADSGNNKIRQVTLDGVVSTFAGTGASSSDNGPKLSATFGGPEGIAVDPKTGNIYVAEWGNNDIRKIAPDSTVSTFAGSPDKDGPVINGMGMNAAFYHPEDLAIDAEGNLYVADADNYAIRKISPTGEVTTLAGLTDANGNGVKGNADGPANKATFSYPWAVAVDATGAVYVADGTTNNRIRKITVY